MQTLTNLIDFLGVLLYSQNVVIPPTFYSTTFSQLLPLLTNYYTTLTNAFHFSLRYFNFYYLLPILNNFYTTFTNFYDFPTNFTNFYTTFSNFYHLSQTLYYFSSIKNGFIFSFSDKRESPHFVGCHVMWINSLLISFLLALRCLFNYTKHE